ncbi:hypothetical protein XENOCAPTIV_014503 [Xenoophorus captivus]|uniref:cAMP-regulated phosphoprotein 19 n=1 Tax=Xenoophorus captivus TaxID=1517983 RepID=A0ABV0RQI1_9TELE
MSEDNDETQTAEETPVEETVSFGAPPLTLQPELLLTFSSFYPRLPFLHNPNPFTSHLFICCLSHLHLFPHFLDFSVSLQQKYFDSGDYNMAKAKTKNKQLPTAAPEKTEITGDHIPTPQDLPQRKPSLVASKLAG